MYLIDIKNLMQAEFLQVVPVSLLQPKDTICCQARDVAEYESGQSYTVLGSNTRVAYLVQYYI